MAKKASTTTASTKAATAVPTVKVALPHTPAKGAETAALTPMQAPAAAATGTDTPITLTEAAFQDTNTKSPQLTHQMISDRAYFLSLNGTPGSQDDHWSQAERELRNELSNHQ